MSCSVEKQGEREEDEEKVENLLVIQTNQNYFSNGCNLMQSGRVTRLLFHVNI